MQPNQTDAITTTNPNAQPVAQSTSISQEISLADIVREQLEAGRKAYQQRQVRHR